MELDIGCRIQPTRVAAPIGDDYCGTTRSPASRTRWPTLRADTSACSIVFSAPESRRTLTRHTGGLSVEREGGGTIALATAPATTPPPLVPEPAGAGVPGGVLNEPLASTLATPAMPALPGAPLGAGASRRAIASTTPSPRAVPVPAPRCGTSAPQLARLAIRIIPPNKLALVIERPPVDASNRSESWYAEVTGAPSISAPGRLIISTSTSVVIFLIAVLIQYSQIRDVTAIQLKFDALIRAVDGARNHLVQLEQMSDEDPARLQVESQRLKCVATQQP